MEAFGQVAIRAVELLQDHQHSTPLDAWSTAAAEIFPQSKSQQEKSCPRSTFLGLCEEGLIIGVMQGEYTSSRLNREYALRAVQILQSQSAGLTPKALWACVTDGKAKAHNSQMDVVIALNRVRLLKLADKQQ